MARSLEPNCPDCGTVAPKRLLLWATKKPFTCAGCGGALIVANRVQMSMIAFAGAMVFLLLRDQQAGWLWNMGLFVLVFCVVGIVSWLKMRIEAANRGDVFR